MDMLGEQNILETKTYHGKNSEHVKKWKTMGHIRKHMENIYETNENEPTYLANKCGNKYETSTNMTGEDKQTDFKFFDVL